MIVKLFSLIIQWVLLQSLRAVGKSLTWLNYGKIDRPGGNKTGRLG